MASTTRAPSTTLCALRSHPGNLAPRNQHFTYDSLFLGRAVGVGDQVETSEIGGLHHHYERVAA